MVASYTKTVMEEAPDRRLYHGRHICTPPYSLLRTRVVVANELKCAYTALLVLLNYSCHYASNEYLAEQLPAILADPQEIADRIYGSKIVVGVNQAYLMTLWGVKACLLML